MSVLCIYTYHRVGATMDMNRRKVLLGLGTAAVGSGIVFGSSAFTQVSADRSLTIQVNEDSAALLELNANSNLTSVSEDNGQLTIDSNKLSGNDEGFNNQARVEIGGTDQDTFGNGAVVDGDEAFNIVNNFDQEIEVTLDASDVQPDDGGTLELVYNQAGKNATRTSSSNTAVLASGETLLVAIEFDTENDPADGNITISAVPNPN